MRKVFLENLPKKYGFGANKDKLSIDWKNCIGCKIKFIYDCIENYLEIIDYVYPNLTIKYEDEIKIISVDSLKNCKLGKMLKLYCGDFKIEIGTTFKDYKRDITIIDREYRVDNSGHRRKYYKYHCNKDGNEDWVEESFLLKGVGCNVCSGNKVMLGINTLYDIEPWVMNLGVSYEDAITHTKCSGAKIGVSCPYCGKIKSVNINNIIKTHSIGCDCGDGGYYPNKFMIEFCNQLLQQKQIKSFKIEYNIKNKKYDLFIILNNEQTLIIENHGEQHGKFIYNGDLLLVKNGKSFTQSKRNDIKEDIYKCWLAYKYNINNYVQLDCSKSNSEYIKNNMKNSLLNELFDLSVINWLKCDEYALKNIVKEVCDYWHEHKENNKEDITTTDLAKLFNITSGTASVYLNKGRKLGWCNYTGNKYTVIVYDLDMNFIGEYESVSWLGRNGEKLFGVKLTQSKISKVCRGEKPNYKGYIFKYKNY